MRTFRYRFVLVLRTQSAITMRHSAKHFKVSSQNSAVLKLTSKVTFFFNKQLNSYFNYYFQGNVQKAEYCAVELNDDKYRAFVYAVKNHYWYQMYIDDLPIWGVVGDMKDNNYYIWTHKKFEVGYNGKQIIDVNLTSEDKTLLTPTAKLSFTYEVVWKPTETKYDDRFDKYLDHNFFQHRVRGCTYEFIYLVNIFADSLVQHL